VEDPGDQDQTADQLGAAQRNQQRHRDPVAAAEQVRRPGHHRLQEGDGIGGHQLVGDGAIDVGGMAMPAPLGGEDVQPRRQRVDVGREGACVGASGVQQHQRLALAVVVVPGAHLAKLHIPWHGRSRPFDNGAAAAAGDRRGLMPGPIGDQEGILPTRSDSGARPAGSGR
jgi:hypothetical protein